MYRDCKMNVGKSSKKVVLELTNSCNLNCEHCFYRQNEKYNSNSFLKKSEAFSLIDKFKKDNIEKLVLTGGEPTIHPDFLDIARYAKKNISKVTLCSNGVISNQILEDEIINLNFDTYTVSIDSHIDMVHNKFRGGEGALLKVKNFTKKLKDSNKNISIHIALHPGNLNHVEETINYCKQRYNCEIVVGSIYYSKLDHNDEAIKEYYSKIEKIKSRYIYDDEIILVGFNDYCSAKNCLDQKCVFTINRFGELVSCYWHKDGGRIIKKY